MPQRRWKPNAAAEGSSDAAAGWSQHLSQIVLPAWQDYLAAEHRLSTVTKAGDEIERLRQSYATLRHGAAAALFLDQFTDVVLVSRPHFLPEDVSSAADVREWLTGYCTHLRTDRIAADVLLLADLAEGLRHGRLTGIVPAPAPEGPEIIVVAPGPTDLPLGEGKAGAVDQVFIQVRSGPRALAAVLQNVVDAWRRAAGRSLPEVGLP